MNETIETVRSDEEEESLLSISEQMHKTPWDFDPGWLLKKKWIVVPVTVDFYPEHVDSIAEKLQPFNDGSIFAALSERFSKFFINRASGKKVRKYSCVAIHNLTSGVLCEDLFRNEDLAILNFVITNPATDFAILCTREEYILVAGPPGFALDALGGSLELVKQDYFTFAEGFVDCDILTYKKLMGVWERYENINKQVEEKILAETKKP